MTTLSPQKRELWGTAGSAAHPAWQGRERVGATAHRPEAVGSPGSDATPPAATSAHRARRQAPSEALSSALWGAERLQLRVVEPARGDTTSLTALLLTKIWLVFHYTLPERAVTQEFVLADAAVQLGHAFQEVLVVLGVPTGNGGRG